MGTHIIKLGDDFAVLLLIRFSRLPLLLEQRGQSILAQSLQQIRVHSHLFRGLLQFLHRGAPCLADLAAWKDKENINELLLGLLNVLSETKDVREIFNYKFFSIGLEVAEEKI